jgi:hypothetical protein
MEEPPDRACDQMEELNRETALPHHCKQCSLRRLQIELTPNEPALIRVQR